MKSLAYIPGSNQAANASLMTVQNVRSAGASDIIVNTVTGAPAKFYASMGAPHTFVDPVTGEQITIISEATAVDFAGHLDSGKVVIDAIAPGYVDTRGSLSGDIVVIRPITEWANNIFNLLSESHNDDGTLKPAAIVYEPTITDFFQSGGIWTATTGLSAAMTAIVAYQAGYRGTAPAIAARAFTASKDTYVDVLRSLSGYTNTFTIVYTEVANGATAPALAANSLRLAKVVTSGAAVTTIVQNYYDNPSGGNSIRNTSPFEVRTRAKAVTTTYDTVNSWVKARLLQKIYDPENGLDVTTNFRYTVTKPGNYALSGIVRIASAGLSTTANATAAIRINGNETVRGLTLAGSGNNNTTPLIQMYDEMWLNPGDYVELWGYCGETRDIWGCSLTVRLIP